MSRARSLKQLAACFSALTSGKTHFGHVSSRTLQPGPAEWCKGRYFAAVSKEDTLKLVKELRAQTGAPIGDVRAALKEAEYDLDAAHDGLRKKGAAVAAKKASRDASQVLIMRMLMPATSVRTQSMLVAKDSHVFDSRNRTHTSYEDNSVLNLRTCA